MSEDLDAFRRRTALLARQRRRTHLVPVADPALVEALESSSTSEGTEALQKLVMEDDFVDEQAADREARVFLEELQRTVHAGRINDVVLASRRAVLDAVVRPFGLGRLVARADRRGGAVLTLHNAETARAEGWATASEFADPNKMAAFRERMEAPFDRGTYEVDPGRKAAIRAATGEDAYTGRPLGDRVNIDHVVSARELHGTGDPDNGVRERPDLAFHMREQQVVAFATSDANLAATDEGLNKSKKAQPLAEWMDKERPDGSTNAERYGVDRDKAIARDAEARSELHRQKQAAAAKYYASGIVKTGAQEAARMGFQQALGLMLVELIEALFDEAAVYLRDRPGLDGTLIPRLRASLETIARRVVSKWREAVAAFRDGAISGFLSNLVTVLLNMIVTTSKRVVRVLREGVFSLGRAVKLIVAPPDHLTPAQAMHEASKLVAAGSMVAAGVIAEEFVEKAIASVPLLVPVAEPLTIIIVGTGTGLATVMLAYLIDEVDVFGVRRDEEASRSHTLLDERLDLAASRLERELSDPMFAGLT